MQEILTKRRFFKSQIEILKFQIEKKSRFWESESGLK